jgi:glutaminyl-peptide cyclotransferase
LKKIFLFMALSLIFYSCDQKPIVQEYLPPFKIVEQNNVPKFDGNYAYEMIEKQVSFGPRNPGSLAHSLTKKFLVEELNKYTDVVIEQSFEYTGYNNEKLPLTNIIGRFNPQNSNRIFFCAHWDSRPRAEKDDDESKRNYPIPGANDGASGVGILLELARVIKENKIPYGIDIIFFDGEDYGEEHDLNNYCLGAKYFSVNKPENFNPHFGILLDLVGDIEAKFYKEGSSLQYARDIVDLVWNLAEKLNASHFSVFESSPVYDDHIPLNQAGIKTINIIDSDLIGANTGNERRNYWHTHKDDMRNIGIETLTEVGSLLTKLIYSLQFRSDVVAETK